MMFRQPHLILLLSLVFPVMEGCAYNPVTGTPELRTSGKNKKWEDAYRDALEFKYKNFPSFLQDHYDNQEHNAIERTRMRNEIISDLKWLTDYYYQQGSDLLLRGDNSINFIGDIVSLGLTSAATISGGAEAKTVLAAIATFTTGTKAAFDADYLHKQTVSTIINEMNSERDKVAKDIVEGLTKSDDVYPLRQRALGDINRYREAGSLMIAIVGLEQKTKAEADASNAALKTATQSADEQRSKH